MQISKQSLDQESIHTGSLDSNLNIVISSGSKEAWRRCESRQLHVEEIFLPSSRALADDAAPPRRSSLPSFGLSTDRQVVVVAACSKITSAKKRFPHIRPAAVDDYYANTSQNAGAHVSATAPQWAIMSGFAPLETCCY